MNWNAPGRQGRQNNTEEVVGPLALGNQGRRSMESYAKFRDENPPRRTFSAKPRFSELQTDGMGWGGVAWTWPGRCTYVRTYVPISSCRQTSQSTMYQSSSSTTTTTTCNNYHNQSRKFANGSLLHRCSKLTGRHSTLCYKAGWLAG